MEILIPGKTCWRTTQALQASFLIDNQSYYAALLQALQKAERSIWILGWAFDPRTRMSPDGRDGPDDPDEIGRILLHLANTRPSLDVRLLIWKSTLPLSGSHDFWGCRAAKWFAGSPVKFGLDGTVPFGASHHQKVVVIDDCLAFCGGGDLTPNRWDTLHHRHVEPRRILPAHKPYPARHEVTAMVEGEAAQELGNLFRERWRTATGEAMPAPAQGSKTLWPDDVRPQIQNARAAVARTQPHAFGRPMADEIRQLTLACIRKAKRSIYLENQYFTCELVAKALAQRLAEPDGPEVVLIIGARSPSWFDRMVMDRARNALICRLTAADKHGRFHAFQPLTSKGAPIIVHSKVSIFDDELVRIGSANLNNRSGGFDTECELALTGESKRTRAAIEDFRDLLISHFLGVSCTKFTQERQSMGGLAKAIEALNWSGRLAPIRPLPQAMFDQLVSRQHLGDPTDPVESWRLRLIRRKF